MANTCLNCGEEAQGVFCHQCGQSIHTTRLTLAQLFRSGFEHLFSLDSTFLRTILGLTKEPGATCQGYIDGKRKTYMSPVRYMLIILGVLILWYSMIDVKIATNPFEQDMNREGTMALVLQDVKFFIRHYINLVLFTALPIYALFLRIAWRTKKHNYTETLCFSIYTITHVQFFGMIIAPLALLSPTVAFTLRFALLVGFVSWAQWQFFAARGAWGAVRALFGVGLYMFSVGLTLSTYIVLKFLLI